jgi:hypothetical protein
MRRNTYVRLVCYDKPPQITLPLYRFAKAGRVTAVLEGRLLDDVRCREGIRLHADYRNGAPIREDSLITSPVVRVEDGYALTESLIIQILRIPPPTSPGKTPGLAVLEEKGIPRQGPRYLTASQRAALRDLVAAAELTGDDATYGGVKLRARPLISGFSGSGKSALVGHLGDVLAAKNGAPCPILKIPAGSWIIYGASKDPNTLVAIRDFLRSNASPGQGDSSPALPGAKAVIFLDEIDKLASRRSSDGWYRSVINEVISLADGDSRLLACGWSNADIASLRQTLIIAAGAFMDGTEHAADQDKDSHLKLIVDHCAIPDEVRLRWNSRLVYIEPPTARDYQDAFHRLYEDLGLPQPQREKLDTLIASAQEAKAGMRFVEEHLADLLIAHPHLRRSPKLTVSVADHEKKPARTFIPRSRYDRLVQQLEQLMHDLEAPLAHSQVLFLIHATQFARVRGDVINPLTNVASTAANLDNDFTLLLDGMRYHLCADDKQRDKCSEDLWLAGHRVLLAVRGATVLEPVFLQDKCLLALFTEVYAQLSRVLQSVKYISSVRAEGTE